MASGHAIDISAASSLHCTIKKDHTVSGTSKIIKKCEENCCGKIVQKISTSDFF